MNHKFDELTKSLSQSLTRRGGAPKKLGLTLACIALALMGLVRAHANEFKLGPLLNLSDSDALHICPDSFPGESRIEHESCIVVNPKNPKNVVVCWIEGGFRASGTAISMDGGKHWESKLIPGTS